jgi:hypothetical protein
MTIPLECVMASCRLGDSHLLAPPCTISPSHSLSLSVRRPNAIGQKNRFQKKYGASGASMLVLYPGTTRKGAVDSKYS